MEPTSFTQSIGRQAGRGLRWSLLGTIVMKVGSFGMGLVLARLLAPADFGLFAVALAATHFVMHVNDVGLIAATVQWQGRFEEVAATAATLAVVCSVAVYAIFWFVAPSFAALAGSPEATPVVRLLSAVILIDGVTAVRSAALVRRFQQDKLTMANSAGFVVNAALSIALAAHGAGSFSFASGQLAGAVVTGVLVFWLAKVPIEVGMDRAIARRLMRFGLPLAGSLGLEAILMNADYVIVGRLMGPAALGFYLLAFNVSSWAPGVIGTAVRYVSVAGFSRLAEEQGELAAGAQKTIPLLVAGVLPITVIMGALAPALVVFLYGAQWLPAAPVLRFLVVLSVARLLTSFVFDILIGTGATRTALWLTLGWALPLIPALVAATRWDGIRGAAIAHSLIAVLVAIPLAMVALHWTGVRLRPIGSALVRPLLAGVLAMVTCLLVGRVANASPLITLVTAGTTGMLGYILAVLPRAQLLRLIRRAGTLIPSGSR